MTPIRRFACSAVLALAIASSAAAQTYHDTAGTIVPGVVPLPFGFTPLSPGQHNLTISSATALTVPNGARYATVCARTAAANYTTDGTTAPTSSVGMALAAGSCVALSGPAVLAAFRAISATGTLDAEFFQ